METKNKVYEVRTYYMVLNQKLEQAGILFDNPDIKQASLDLWEKLNELEKQVSSD